MCLRLLLGKLALRCVLFLGAFLQIAHSSPCLAKLKSSPEGNIKNTSLEVVTAVRAREIVAEAMASESDVFLFRGVAPSEAKAALENSQGDGRVAGLQRYGVADRAKVAYVLSDSANMGKTTSRQRYDIFKDFMFYGNGGAAIEESKARLGTDYGGDISLASTIFPEARGYILVYKFEPSTKLDAHPESNATINKRVVAVPSGAKPYAVLPMPESIDEDTGLPQY